MNSLDDVTVSDKGSVVISWKEVETVKDFEDLMQGVRDIRRQLVKEVLRGDCPIDSSCIVSLQNAIGSLEKGMEGFSKDVRLDADPSSPEVHFNLKDEVSGLQKDIAFLNYFMDGSTVDELVNALSTFHPKSGLVFLEELGKLEKFMSLFLSGIHIFITDWDGTMKNYCSNYATCMQPAYSAVVMARFADRFARHSAVLTAGPLRDPGILDLTCVPPDGDWLTFGGSWGREWLLKGERVVDESSFTEEGRRALEELTKELRMAVKNPSGKYFYFQFVGSGFQKKVDRITLGVQNVSGDISEERASDYMGMVRGLVEKVDPKREHFVIREEKLDVEVVLRASTTQLTWDKARGVELLLKHMEADMGEGRCLICGDTISDIPMVEFAMSKNPKNTYAIFVNPSAQVVQRLSELLDEGNYCLVSCPEVVHAAMAKLLLIDNDDV